MPASIKFFAIALVGLNAAVAIALLLLLCGGDPVRPLTFWGLVWRSAVATVASALIKLLIQSVFSIDHTLVEFSLFNVVAWEVFSLLAIAVSVWVLFSPNRRGQLRMLLSAVRGY
jgi:hypothetical protein